MPARTMMIVTAMTAALAGCEAFVQQAGPEAPARRPAAPQPLYTPASAAEEAIVGPVSPFGDILDLPPRANGPLIMADLRQHSYMMLGQTLDPSVNRDGTMIAFATTSHSDKPDIFLKTLTSKTITQLTTSGASDIEPEFSPDGKRVAFASNRSGAWELYVVDLDGGNLRQVTKGGGQNLHPSWSPTGRRLVYCCRSDRTGAWELYTVQLDVPDSRKYLGDGLFPVFSPTDERIAYQRSRGPGSRLFGIWTMDLSGERPGLPTLVISSPRMAYVSPAYSTDRAELAFTALSPSRPDLDGDIMVINVEGENLHRLTAGPGQKFGPVWALDRVYFSSSRDGTENIWSVLTGSPSLVGENAKNAPAMTNRAVGEPESVDLAQSPTN